MMFEMSQLDMTSEERDMLLMCVVVVAGKIVRRWVVPSEFIIYLSNLRCFKLKSDST